MTDAEGKLWARLRANQIGFKFRRQVPFRRYILDFFCPKAKLAIKIDGSQHYTTNGRRKDEERDRSLLQHGITTLRFSSVEALENTDGVLQRILESVNSRLEKQTPS